MLTRRKLTIAAVTMASMAMVLGLAALPDASADGCTVVITVAELPKTATGKVAKLRVRELVAARV